MVENLFLVYFSGGDKANEDIDIDGNDPPVSPVSNYPSLEIEKEADYKKGTCSRSSNTSSESGSSSSGLYFLDSHVCNHRYIHLHKYKCMHESFM